MSRILFEIEYFKVRNVIITSDNSLFIENYIDVTNDIYYDEETHIIINKILNGKLDVFNESIYYKNNKLYFIENYNMQKLHDVLGL